MRYARQSVLVFISTVVLGGQAWAEPLRLEERIAADCVIAARELRPRVERVLGSSAPNELEASVAIEAFGTGYRVRIGLRDAAEARGTTVVEAPTCDEAVDAAAVVLALAFGNVNSSDATVPAPSTPAPAFVSPAPSDGLRAPLDREPESSSEGATRIALATGVDGGTLPQPTLTLAGAVVHPLGGYELAAVARYGLPIADERVESDFSESQRHDFGGLELRACRGVGDAVRVSGCAGTEVAAVRARHAREGEDRAGVRADFAPRLSGTFAALVAHRGGLVEPGLELGAAAVALGREAGAPWLVLRIAAGAAFTF